jgi:hypothetical protein
LGERRELGGALLRHLVLSAPRSTIAGHARNKLRLEAFPVADLEAAPANKAVKTPQRPRPRATAKKTS